MSDVSTVDIEAVEFYTRIRDEMGELIIGNDRVIRGMTVALLTDGHILLEGVPGVAKTSLAEAFSRVTGLGYNRIQMTPDTLPADLSGTTIYEEASGTFKMQKGPVFTNVVVADEINRATPKTQSALLEAMQEQQVTIGDRTLSLPDPFVVIATQNPIEMEGVFELPEAQRDRFQQKYTVKTPDRTDEATLLDRFDENPRMTPEVVEQAVDPEEIAHVQQLVADVHVARPIKQYILDLVGVSETGSRFLGAPTVTLPLSELQEITGKTATDPATIITVTTADGTDTRQLETQLQQTYPDLEVRTNREQLQATLERQAVVLAGGASLVILAVITGLALTLNVLLSMVYQQLPEYAALKSLGMSTATIAGVVFTQALVVGALGAAVGLASAAPLAAGLDVVALAVTGFEGVVRLTPQVLALGFGAAVAMTLLTGVVASWRLSGLEPKAALDP